MNKFFSKKLIIQICTLLLSYMLFTYNLIEIFLDKLRLSENHSIFFREQNQYLPLQYTEAIICLKIM